MNFQTSLNLQIGPLFTKLFHSNLNNMRDRGSEEKHFVSIDFIARGAEKIPFVSVGITHLVLMFGDLQLETSKF